MTNRAWLSGGRLYVECDACGSTGTAIGTTVLHMTDEAKQSRQAFVETVKARNKQFVAALARMRADGTMVKNYDGARASYDADLMAIVRNKPGPLGVTETLPKCPWCGAGHGAVIEPEKLPSGAAAS